MASKFLISVAVDYYTATSRSQFSASWTWAGTSTTPSSSILLVVLLVLLALIAHLFLLAIIVELQQAAAALSPAAVLMGWLGNLAININLAVTFRIFGFELCMIGNAVMLAARNS